MHDRLAIRLDSTSAVLRDGPCQEYFSHSSAPRVNTDTQILSALELQYPNRHISIIPEFQVNLLAFAAAGHALVIPDPDRNATETGPLKWTSYAPPARRLDGQQGALVEEVLFGKYKYAYQNADFVMYLVDGRDGQSSYPVVRNQYLISSSTSSANADALVIAAGQFGAQLHNEVWVFNNGYWQKDRALWEAVQNADWDDVILDADMKKNIINDVMRFYDSRDTYTRLKVPWKRGIIYYGPPGNGKTISIKAMMHSLYKRAEPVPTLYVKTLAGYAPPEYMLGQIFGKARAEAPCYLVFEDLDSIVSDNVRSFFLNEVDGLSANDGILMVGSTNHLDRLDPGIAKRPSRFDRKYLFPNPVFKERVQYAEYWRNKLKGGDGDDGVEFPKEICNALANITDSFSFAYLQEAFVATLLVIAGQRDLVDTNEPEVACELLGRSMGEYFIEHGGSWTVKSKGFNGMEDDLDDYVLWRELKKQVKILRDEIDGDKGE